MPLEDHGDGRHDELRRAGDHHDLADLHCIVIAHEGQEHGHQIDSAVEPDAEDEAEQAAKGKAGVAEHAQLDDGCLALMERCHKPAPGSQASREQNSRVERYPAGLRRLLQSDLQAGERDSHRASAIGSSLRSRPSSGFSLGSRLAAIAMAATPGATLMRNSQGQP